MTETSSSELEGRTLISIGDPEFALNFSELYNGLVEEFVAACKAKGRENVQGYAVMVPDDINERGTLKQVLTMSVINTWFKRIGQDVEDFATTLPRLLPPPNSTFFAQAINTRTSFTENRLKGGALAAMAAVIRYHGATNNVEATRRQVSHLVSDVLDEDGKTTAVRDLPEKEWHEVVGKRVIRLDSEREAFNTAQNGRELDKTIRAGLQKPEMIEVYERICAAFESKLPALTAVFLMEQQGYRSANFGRRALLSTVLGKVALMVEYAHLAEKPIEEIKPALEVLCQKILDFSGTSSEFVNAVFA